MPEKELDYKKDLEIDNDALDVEFLRQPQLLMKYSEMAADARLETDRAKELVDVVRAECDREIRDKANKEGIKITEAVVSNQIVLHLKYKGALENFNNVRHRLDIFLSAVKAFDYKKSSLENLVKLWQGSYFAGPIVPRDLGKEAGFAEKVKEQGREVVRNKIRSRMRKLCK